jgi:hypothetical protein
VHANVRELGEGTANVFLDLARERGASASMTLRIEPEGEERDQAVSV